MNKKWIVFWIIWAGIISLGPITLFRDSPLASVLGNKALLANFIQRFLGMLLISLIFIQIVLGAFMSRWTDILGGKIFRFHILEGITAYTIAILHPLSFVFFNYFIKGSFDPFYVFTDVCVLCKTPLELYYTLGRVSFWFLTLAVFAALFRTEPFIMRHWRKFHVLNYAVFFLVVLHSWFIGTDTRMMPFKYFYFVAVPVVVVIVILKVKKYLSRGYQKPAN